ncbi:hypothetical protein I6E68_00785 [Salinibacterium sp. NSLL150]|uniref:hypothetical protein n=1 Tax=unclassified Salinibacterium TaxID=2632331 RepID=UPI0018CFA095|nr:MULTISPECIES: hypothetical protein [unclassified Salinibacterium]MBH0097670.1 hypothetical protein [Salinibacterium sp. NSLL35]MBH0100425.1 hypothetical protein [Salinibacterium sp. NSLL150]MBH0103184.1 hypothetical protein [Salinibacterium sp. NSLL16]MBH0105945.1 hypothetical protein [Salinibacterium sp. NSLL17]
MLLFLGAIVAGLLIGTLHAKVRVPAGRRLTRAGTVILALAGAAAVLVLRPDGSSLQLSFATLVAYAVCFGLASAVVRGLLWHRLLPDSGRTAVQTIGRSFLHTDEIYDEWMLFLQSEIAATAAGENAPRR